MISQLPPCWLSRATVHPLVNHLRQAASIVIGTWILNLRDIWMGIYQYEANSIMCDKKSYFIPENMYSCSHRKWSTNLYMQHTMIEPLIDSRTCSIKVSGSLTVSASSLHLCFIDLICTKAWSMSRSWSILAGAEAVSLWEYKHCKYKHCKFKQI